VEPVYLGSWVYVIHIFHLCEVLSDPDLTTDAVKCITVIGHCSVVYDMLVMCVSVYFTSTCSYVYGCWSVVSLCNIECVMYICDNECAMRVGNRKCVVNMCSSECVGRVCCRECEYSLV
jgi:hypothetical protein